jgi:hypothetical protein
MVVSGLIFLSLSNFWFGPEEARKPALSSVEEKRTFFPEDIVDSDSLFHLCLLFRYPLSPWERAGVRERSLAAEEKE